MDYLVEKETVIPSFDNFKHLRYSSDILIGEELDPEIRKKYPDISPYLEIKKSLRSYYGTEHDLINNAFRMPEILVYSKTKKDIENIDLAMKKIKPYRLIDDFVVWRGIKIDEKSMNGAKRYFEELKQFPTKKYSNNPSYLSTSYEISTALNFAECCLFEIIVRRSENLEYILIEKEGEKELLFQHSTHFKYIRHTEKMYRKRDQIKRLTFFEVELKKGLVPEEKSIPMNESKETDRIIKRAQNFVSSEDVENEAILSTMEEIQEDLYNSFILQLKREYPLQVIDSIQSQIKYEIYKSVQKFYPN